MNDRVPFAVFLANGALWLATSIYGRRLFYRFRERFPIIAENEIPYAFDQFRHPEKCIFFFRRRAKEILRDDPLLWKQRQRFLILFALSVVIPILSFLSLAIFAFAEAQK